MLHKQYLIQKFSVLKIMYFHDFISMVINTKQNRTEKFNVLNYTVIW